MYNVSFVNNTTKVVGRQSAAKWIGTMEKDYGYFDWMYDWLIQASQDYDLIIDNSVIIFSDKE